MGGLNEINLCLDRQLVDNYRDCDTLASSRPISVQYNIVTGQEVERLTAGGTFIIIANDNENQQGGKLQIR